MKHKRLKTYLKFGILLFGIFAIIMACKKDDSITQQDKTTQSVVPVIKTVSYDEVSSTLNNLADKHQLHRFLDIGLEFGLQGKSTTDTLGITVRTDKIKEVILDDYTSYTMKIAKDSTETDSKFYNLTIEDKSGVSKVFVTKYEPTEHWLSNQREVFQGNVSTMSIDDFTHAPPDDGGGGTNHTGSGSTSAGDPFGTPEASPYYPTDCNGIVIVTYEDVPYPCSCDPSHMPWQSCHCDQYGGTLPGYTQIPYYYCQDYGSGDIGDDPPDTTNPGFGSGTSTGTGVNPDDSSITVLLPPDEICEDPPPGDLNGDCQLDAYESCLLQGNSQEICDCVANGGILFECKEDIKCERLKRLVQTYGLGSNILPIINQLRTKLSAGNNEWSISFKNVWSEYGRKNVPDDNGISEGTSSTRSIADYETTWVGFIHTHPEGGYSVFSWLDLRVLKLLHTDSHDNFNDEVFIMAVAPNNITYALKVDNIQTLIDEIDADMQNARGNTDREKMDNIMKKMKKKYDKSVNLKQTFLKLYGDYGVSLYKATDTNLSNWIQLELDRNDNETINEIPCN